MGDVSGIGSRLGMLAAIGQMFNGKRNLWDAFGYNRNLTYTHMLEKYRRQDITSRIVDAPADALWTNPPKFITEDAAWTDAWEAFVKEQKLWGVIGRADKMAGMGNYAALLVGFDGGSKLDIPVSYQKSQKVLYLQPYSVDSAEIDKFVSDPANARFRQPEVYSIGAVAGKSVVGKGVSTTKFAVHYSRILHVCENPLQDNIYGNPRLERVWNLLDDLLKVVGGTAETFWLTSNRGMQIDVDKEMELTPDDEKNLNDEIDEYVHQLRRVIRTRGVKINNLGSDVPDPRNTFDVLLSLISGATGIPKRILLGSEAGQLASDQDRNNWAERVDERRKHFGEDIVLIPLLNMLTAAGVLPEAQVEIEWPDPFKMTPLEKAQTAAHMAKSATSLAKAMETNPTLVTVDESRHILGL